MKRLSLFLLILIFFPLGVLLFEELQARRPGAVSGCPDWVLTQTKSAKEVIHPERIVIQPWQGRHNVFAIFKVPEGYIPGSAFVVALNGSNPYCGQVTWESPSGESGEHLVFGPFRTRTTLWLISKGQLSQLEQPNNWKLAIFKQP